MESYCSKYHHRYFSNGWIEVIDGVDAGIDIVIDGAGYLTNDASIKVKEMTLPELSIKRHVLPG